MLLSVRIDYAVAWSEGRKIMGKAYPVNELNNATFTNDILEDAVFFMFAEGGAMGEPGGILFVTEGGEVYHGNYAFGDLEMDTVEAAFPVLAQCSFGMFGQGSEVPMGWEYVNLGAGNHLIVHMDYAEQFRKKTRQYKKPVELFQNWLEVALDLTGGSSGMEEFEDGPEFVGNDIRSGLLSGEEENETRGKHKEDKAMSDIFVTITGTQFRHGSEFLEKGMIIKLVKEPDNEYDKEAIRAEIKPVGKIGYVANSVRTVIGDCYSAGRLYDKIGDKAKAEVVFVLPSGVIARVKIKK